MNKLKSSFPDIIEHVNPLSGPPEASETLQESKEPWDMVYVIDSLIRLLQSVRITFEPDK